MGLHARQNECTVVRMQAVSASATTRLCRPDNWDSGTARSSVEENAPRAIRWATRTLSRLFNDPDWGKWHYTEGNGSFTACGEPVVIFAVDGSPQEKDDLKKVTCKRCLSKMRKTGVHLTLAN